MTDKELDALVAEKVMMWRLTATAHSVNLWVDQDNLLTGWCDNEWPSTDNWSNRVWRPLTDIACTWQVVKKLLERELDFCLYTSHGEWICELNIYYVDDDEALVIEKAETPGLAICLAALRSRG